MNVCMYFSFVQKNKIESGGPMMELYENNMMRVILPLEKHEDFFVSEVKVKESEE